MVSVDIEPIKRILKTAYNGPEFPMMVLGGSIVAVALTDDIIWLGVGIAGFVYFLFINKRKGDGLHL